MVYISGKVTGTDDYLQRFAEAENKLTQLGYKVVNPVKVTSGLPSMAWREYMQITLACLSVCEAIFVIDGENDSKGVRCELEYAAKHGIYRLWNIENKVDKGENV